MIFTRMLSFTAISYDLTSGFFLDEKFQPLGSSWENFGAWDRCLFIGGGRLQEVAGREGLTLCLMRKQQP